MAPRGQLVFAAGVGSLVFVPVFKQLTGLPPFLGMLLGLGGLWVLTDAVHYGEPQRQRLKVGQALSRIDTQGVLFFLGILMSVSAMSSMGLLKEASLTPLPPPVRCPCCRRRCALASARQPSEPAPRHERRERRRSAVSV